MPKHEIEDRLSHIATLWTQLRLAHQDPSAQRESARQEILRRYSGAIYRYLVRAVGNASVAEDLCQEFAVRFLEGRFSNADPERGRFRDYLKTSLFHLVGDHRRREARQPHATPLEPQASVGANEPVAEKDDAFDGSWRQELLELAWRALEAWQQESGTPYYDALRLRVEKPEQSAQEIANQLSARLGTTLNETQVRKLLERARRYFAHRVLEEVHRSLGACSRDQLEEELANLHLLKYCAGALSFREP